MMKSIMVKALATVLATLVIVSGLMTSDVQAKTKYCIKSGCYNSASSGSSYCYKHKSSSKSTKSSSSSKNKYSNSKSSSKKSGSSKKKTYHDSYDDGYDDVYMNEDYDWDRYCNDWDYASGVDDALDDEAWDF